MPGHLPGTNGQVTGCARRFGHPQFPVFARKPLFGYKGMVFATIAITAYSAAVWGHHMYATGAILLPFFAGMTYIIAVPTGIKFVNWIGTMWHGKITFETPMLWARGCLVTVGRP
jgi:cytochrome c oxidase subunit 1